MGGLTANEKVRSGRTVIWTRMGVPECTSLVRSLNCLQKSMAFTPRCPNAGPMGGVGVAWPAGTQSFTIDAAAALAAFFDMTFLSFGGEGGGEGCVGGVVMIWGEEQEIGRRKEKVSKRAYGHSFFHTTLTYSHPHLLTHSLTPTLTSPTPRMPPTPASATASYSTSSPSSPPSSQQHLFDDALARLKRELLDELPPRVALEVVDRLRSSSSVSSAASSTTPTSSSKRGVGWNLGDYFLEGMMVGASIVFVWMKWGTGAGGRA